MYKKIIESLEMIDKDIEKCYQELRKECKTYKELEKAIRDINYINYSPLLARTFLKGTLLEKMKEEQGKLPVQ